MSHTGTDPHARESQEISPAKARMAEIDRLAKSGLWGKAKALGLTVEVFARDFHGVGAWISADEVERLLERLAPYTEPVIEMHAETKAP